MKGKNMMNEPWKAIFFTFGTTHSAKILDAGGNLVADNIPGDLAKTLVEFPNLLKVLSRAHACLNDLADKTTRDQWEDRTILRDCYNLLKKM